MNRDRFSGAGRLPRYLFSATKFLIFFALIAFVVTCSFLLFLDSMRLDPDILRENALLTFLNILLLSALFTVIDGIRRRLTVERRYPAHHPGRFQRAHRAASRPGACRRLRRHH